jgi:hypothetical protein
MDMFGKATLPARAFDYSSSWHCTSANPMQGHVDMILLFACTGFIRQHVLRASLSLTRPDCESISAPWTPRTRHEMRSVRPAASSGSVHTVHTLACA